MAKSHQEKMEERVLEIQELLQKRSLIMKRLKVLVNLEETTEKES